MSGRETSCAGSGEARLVVTLSRQRITNRALGERTLNEFAHEIAANCDFIGMQTSVKSPEGWYSNARLVK